MKEKVAHFQENGLNSIIQITNHRNGGQLRGKNIRARDYMRNHQKIFDVKSIPYLIQFRISLDEVLDHPYFARCSEEGHKKTAYVQQNFEWDSNPSVTINQLRQAFLEIVLSKASFVSAWKSKFR